MRKVAGLMVAGLMASAATVSAQDITTALGSEWNVRLDGGTDGTAFTGSCDSSPALNLNDARSTTGDGDMYDNAWSVWVDDSPFAPAAISVAGNVVTAGPETLSGLAVSLEYRFSDTIEAFRTLATFSNPTANPITVAVDVPVNFGSDSSTTVVTTSSGDTSFTVADGWVVTWDTSSEINTTVFYGPGGGVTPVAVTQTVFSCAGTQGAGASFNLTVPAGAVQRLMFFAGIAEIDGTGDSDTTNAAANAQQFSSLATIDASLTADLSPTVLATIANWNPVAQPPAPPTAIPVIPGWGLVLLVLSMLGLAPLAGSRLRGFRTK